MATSAAPHNDVAHMRNIFRLARWAMILAIVALVLITSSSLLQHLVRTHEKAPYFFLLSFLVGVSATFTAMLAAYLLELLLTGWVGSSLEALWKGRASVKLDVLAVLVTQLPHKHLDYILSLGLIYIIGTRLPHPAGLSIAHWLPSWGLQVGCALLLSSLVSYWIHRLEHSIPALWALHKFHHSADRLAILTTARDTKLSGALDSALRVLPIAILSVPVAAKPTAASPAYMLVGIYFLFTALTRLNSFVIHSNLDLGYGWIGRWLLVSPRMHRVHHSNSPAYFNRNFSFDLVLWDRLFGTYALCEEAAKLPIGLADNPFNSSSSLKGVLRDYFLTTYVEFWRAVKKGPKAWLPTRLADDRQLQTRT
jgi:sterol desaturase/sphingolipid hydroxylase (fatty acid hydroxylase superfamily)